MPDLLGPRLPRRGFLGLTAATAAVATLSTAGVASASASGLLDRAAGPVGQRVLAQRGGEWVLADVDGRSTPTAGLVGADVVAVTRGPDGFVAVGSFDGKAVIWESADGIAWTPAQRRNEPEAAFTAVGAGPAGVLVLGSLLTAERAPQRAVAAVRTQSRDWLTLPVRGLASADQRHMTAVTGTANGWTAASVDPAGSVVFHSEDGIAWREGTRVTASAIRELDGSRWVGNALDDTAPVRGVLGQGRELVAVPRDAHAVGGGFWFTGGRIVREA